MGCLCGAVNIWANPGATGTDNITKDERERRDEVVFRAWEVLRHESREKKGAYDQAGE